MNKINKKKKLFSEKLFEEIDLVEKNNHKGVNLPNKKEKHTSKYFISKETKFEMRLYTISKMGKNIFFNSEQELINYINQNNLSPRNINIVDFIGRCANKDDVIRIIDINQKILLYTPCDEDGYGLYNEEKSSKEQNYVWEYHYGDISEFYSEFRKRGIIFKNDIYDRIEKRNKKFLKLCKENNLFHCNNS